MIVLAEDFAHALAAVPDMMITCTGLLIAPEPSENALKGIRIIDTDTRAHPERIESWVELIRQGDVQHIYVMTDPGFEGPIARWLRGLAIHRPVVYLTPDPGRAAGLFAPGEVRVCTQPEHLRQQFPALGEITICAKGDDATLHEILYNGPECILTGAGHHLRSWIFRFGRQPRNLCGGDPCQAAVVRSADELRSTWSPGVLYGLVPNAKGLLFFGPDGRNWLLRLDH